MQLKNKMMYAACLLAFLATGCNKKTGGNSEADPAAANTRVTVFVAKTMEYTPELTFTGTAKANKEANLGASIPGRVEKIHYAKGSYVPAGALIVEMSDELLIQAQIEMETLRKDLERMARLREKESVSQIDYDHLKARFDASQSKVEMLKKNTSIQAPFGGILTDISVQEGENYSFIPSVGSDMSLQSGIVTIRQLNPLKVCVEVNEKEIASIRRGQNAELLFDAYPGKSVAGKVSYLSPVLSPMTRTSTVEISVPNNDMKLKPGMYCRTAILMPEATGVFVPVNALLRKQGTGDEYVFIVNDDNRTVSRRKISRGIAKGNLLYIDGITAGERVVIDGKNKLDEGSAVEIANQE